MKSFKITVDGSQVHTEDLSSRCTPDCPATATSTWPLRPSQYSPGEHLIETTVTDKVGNVTVDSLLFETPAPPVPEPKRTLSAGDSQLRIDGAAAGDAAGSSVAPAGDVNGDDRQDFLVGAPQHDGARGAVYLVHGREGGGTIDLASGGDGVVRFTGAAPGDRAGSAIQAVGDINDDSFDDFLIGAPRMPEVPELALLPRAGSVYAIFGGESMRSISLADLGPGGFRIDGPPALLTLPALNGDPPVSFGHSLGGAGTDFSSVSGDVNRDKRDDFILGASDQGPGGRLYGGTAWVIFGKDDNETISLAAGTGERGYEIYGPATYARAGQAVTILDDLDQDHRAEVLLMAPGDDGDRANSGSAYMVFGKDDTSPIDLHEANLGKRGYRIRGRAGDRLGGGAGSGTAAAVGDVNRGGDDTDYILGGATTYQMFANADHETVDLAGSGFSGYRITTPAGTPTKVSVAGDINGDRYFDALVSTPKASQTASYVVFGKEDRNPVAVEQMGGHQGFAVNRAAADDDAGRATYGIEDATGDGRPDMLLGAPAASNGARTRSGSLYVLANPAGTRSGGDFEGSSVPGGQDEASAPVPAPQGGAREPGIVPDVAVPDVALPEAVPGDVIEGVPPPTPSLPDVPDEVPTVPTPGAPAAPGSDGAAPPSEPPAPGAATEDPPTVAQPRLLAAQGGSAQTTTPPPPPPDPQISSTFPPPGTVQRFAPARSLPSNWWRGMNLYSGGFDWYGRRPKNAEGDTQFGCPQTPLAPEAVKAIRRIQGSHDHLVLVPNLYIKRIRTSRDEDEDWFSEPKHILREGCRQSGRDITVSPTHLKAATLSFRGRGRQVLFAPHIEWPGNSRTNYRPSDKSAFMKHYEKQIMAYGRRAASSAKASMLMIGHEIPALVDPSYNGYWNRLINNLAGRHRRLTLVMALNWNDVRLAIARAGSLSWLRNPNLDIIGISAYWPLVESPDVGSTDIPTLFNGWKARGRPEVTSLYEATRPSAGSGGRQIGFTEIGYAKCVGAAKLPYEDKPSPGGSCQSNALHQRQAVHAAYCYWTQWHADEREAGRDPSWFRGFMWWDVDISLDGQEKPAPNSHDVVARGGALGVIDDWNLAPGPAVCPVAESQ